MAEARRLASQVSQRRAIAAAAERLAVMTPVPRILRLMVWIYRRLLRLYPQRFRAEYGGAMSSAKPSPSTMDAWSPIATPHHRRPSLS